MTSSTASLLGGFDFNFTSQTPSSPPISSPPHRPPTPDPRNAPTTYSRRPSHHSLPSSSTADDRRRLRKKPTAIFVGGANNGSASTYLPCAHNAKSAISPPILPHSTLASPLPLFLPPSTPSPRFATSPSLSSSGTTIQSSPTLTPTTAYLGSSYSEPQPVFGELEALNAGDSHHGASGLRRAKRLPHRDQGLWEVHAVVCVSENNDTGDKQEHNTRFEHHEQRTQRQHQDPLAGSTIFAQRPTTNTASEHPSAKLGTPTTREWTTDLHTHTLSHKYTAIPSQPDCRDSELKAVQKADSSSYSLAKFHFPAPPGDYRVGPCGASFDLVNPHASLLLSTSHIETPAEIDGLLDDYFEDPDAMPRALYTDPATARRNIMGLEESGEAAVAATSSEETSAASLVPTRAASDPFDLRVTDVPSQAALPTHESTAEASTIDAIYEEYDYTRETPFENEETLRALESGTPVSFSDDAVPADWATWQEHMSTVLSGRPSEPPTSERTYGDTNQLLGIARRQPGTAHSPGNDGANAQIRPAPGRSTTETTITELRLRSAAASLHDADSPLASAGSHNTVRARGDGPEQFGFRDFSHDTLRSDGEGDWETTRSDSNNELLRGHPRPSQESYANTSTYSEANRLSAMTDVTVAGTQSYAPYRAAMVTPNLRPDSNAGDVEKARKALKKIYKDKVLEQGLVADLFGDNAVRRETRHKDRGILQGLRTRRQSALLEARENDIELEEIRKKNPDAVRQAADEIYNENVARQPIPEQSRTPMERLHGLFSRSRPTQEQLANRSIMDDALMGDDNRNLLAATPTTTDDGRSRLAFSESANTFRTVRDSPAPSITSARDVLDHGLRPFDPAVLSPAYNYERRHNIERRHNYRHAITPESRSHDRNKAPQRFVRRAAMSSQTSLRAFITSGSPTSNIRGAFTDRELAEAYPRWDIFPRRPSNHNQRYISRNASGPFPHFPNSPIRYPDITDRMLIRPDEVMDVSTLMLQERLSKRYLARVLPFPPLCAMYYFGHLDYLIAKESDGRVKVMSKTKKYEAKQMGLILSFVYALIIVGIAIGAMVASKH